MSVLQNNKKKSIAIGIAAVAAAALALGAGTYAAFTDTESGPNATFAAGTLNLTVGSTVTSDPATLTDLAPGDERTIAVTFDNTGTVDGNLTLAFQTSGAENGCTEPETDAEPLPCDPGSELLESLLVSVPSLGVVEAPLTGANGFQLDAGLLAANPGPVTYTFTVEVDPDAGNEIMTDSATLTTVATLEQV